MKFNPAEMFSLESHFLSEHRAVMTEAVKRRMWGGRRLGRGYFDHLEIELPPPYAASQLDEETHPHNYLQGRGVLLCGTTACLDRQEKRGLYEGI